MGRGMRICVDGMADFESPAVDFADGYRCGACNHCRCNLFSAKLNKLNWAIALQVAFNASIDYAVAMSKHEIIHTANAPDAIGAYSQAVKVGNTVYISGQIPLDPATMEVVDQSFEAAAHRVFQNLAAVAEAAGGNLNDAVKVNISLTDLSNFAAVNQVMAQYFEEPYPARAAVGVAALPKDVSIEVEAVLVVG